VPDVRDVVAASAPDLAYVRLREDLRRGVHPKGGRLPGERDLAEALGVSRSTLRQALGRLADEGLLMRSSQRGWFVPRGLGEPPSVLQSFSEMAHARGLRPTARVLHRDERPATLREAELLAIAPSAPVVALSRLRGMDEVAVCVDDTVLAASRARPLLTADLTDRSLFDVLAVSCGVVVARSAFSVQALPADATCARLLGLDPGAPVLEGREVTYDAAGVPVLLGRSTYRGDAYRFQADLYRPLG